MAKRVSRSLLDPLMVPLVPKLYKLLPIPRRFPPEGIVALGHLVAIGGAFGFAYSTRFWWGGVAAAAGVAGNHLCDMLDGTHARSTDQCRNGGELLDHFTDPLSFSYWAIGIAVSVGDLRLGLAAVVIIYATAVLTSIKAKLIGTFELARFGPTEMKAIFTLYGLALAGLIAWPIGGELTQVALVFFCAMICVGVLQLIVGLIKSVIDVNKHGEAPDASAWQLGDDKEKKV